MSAHAATSGRRTALPDAVVGGSAGRVAPDFVQLARAAVDRLVNGDYPALYAMFDGKMRAMLPEEELRGVWATVESQNGALRKLGDPKRDVKGDFRLVTIPAEFEKQQAAIQVHSTHPGS